MPVKERHQQRLNMLTIDVRIGHDDNFVITHFFDIKVILANTRTHCCNQRTNRIRPQHLVKAHTFDIQNFTTQRQNRLGFAVAPLFGCTTRRIPLNNEQFAPCRVAF